MKTRIVMERRRETWGGWGESESSSCLCLVDSCARVAHVRWVLPGRDKGRGRISVFRSRERERAPPLLVRNVANTHSAVNIHPVYRGYVKMQRSPRISFVIPGVDRSLDKRNKWEIIVGRVNFLVSLLIELFFFSSLWN